MALSQQEILSGLANLVNEETGIPVADITAEKAFVEDLDIDSLSMMTIVVGAQDEFGVEIPDEDVTKLKTVGDAVAYISNASQTVSQA